LEIKLIFSIFKNFKNQKIEEKNLEKYKIQKILEKISRRFPRNLFSLKFFLYLLSYSLRILRANKIAGFP
jgi:hypothetical protein